jgi:hypothetical protein
MNLRKIVRFSLVETKGQPTSACINYDTNVLGHPLEIFDSGNG